MSRLALRACSFLVAAGLPVLGLLLAHAPAQAAGGGPVLVVVAHPDDEALGMAGVIANARAAGRRVYVAILTNGDAGGSGSTSTPYCEAPSGSGRYAAGLGLERDGESIGAMGELGLSWSTDLSSTDIFFLGYPDSKLTSVGSSSGGITSDPTGLRRTYARAGDGSPSDSCNGDFGYLTSGNHSSLNKNALALDFDRLLARTQPTDIYTHSSWEGHADHGEVADQVAAAAARSGLALAVHGTMIHPAGTASCDAVVDRLWPNPPGSSGSDPKLRMAGTVAFDKPPTPTCSSNPTGSSWGSAGAPDERLEVPASMQGATEATNLKWKVIEHYASQMNCSDWSSPWCGYMHGFVKRDEIFWVQSYNGGGTPPDVTPPAKPAKPTATSLDKSARLNLSPLNTEGDLDSYTLQRKKNSDTNWSNAKTGVTSWPVTDTGLTNGTAYNYRVIAIDEHGNDSTPSDPVTVTPADTTKPAAPATPTATALDGSVRVNLSPVNTEGDLDSYILQRKKTSDASWVSVKTGITAWPYTDAALTNGTSYDYRVIAVDNATNQSAPSGVVSATPVATAVTPPTVLTPVAPPVITGPLTPVGPGADVTALKISFRRPRPRALAWIEAKGLTAKVRCSEGCTLTARLDLLVTFTNRAGKKTVHVRQLGLSGSSTLSKAGSIRLTVRLNRAGRKLLAQTRGRVKFTVLATDVAGNRAQASRRITVSR